MNCGRISNQLSAYIDCELTGDEMRQIRRHLSDCDRCRAEHEALLQLKTMLGRLSATAPHTGFVAATLHRFAGRPASSRRLRSDDASIRSTQRNPGPLQVALTYARRLAAGLSADAFHHLAPGAWRLTLGLTTAALALALVSTTVGLRRPRHPDALVATSPLSVLQGHDPLSSELVLDQGSISLLDNESQWKQLPPGQPLMNWRPVSVPGEYRRNLP
jgi:anti-sigma factor RsiW